MNIDTTRISKSRRCARTNSRRLQLPTITTREHLGTNLHSSSFSNTSTSIQKTEIVEHMDSFNTGDLLSLFNDQVPAEEGNFSYDDNLLENIIIGQDRVEPSFLNISDTTDSTQNHDYRNHNETPIFSTSTITNREASFYVLAFMTRHNLSGVASDDLMKLIQFLLPRPNSFPETINKLEKLVGLETIEIKLKEYCQNCRLEYFIGPLNQNQQVSDFCGCANYDLRNFDNFYFVNVYDKITFLVEQYFDTIQHYFSTKRSTLDIIDSEYYKSIAKENTLHLMICADGTPIRKSSKKKEFWPVILSLVELPRPLRDSVKNKVICGKFEKSNRLIKTNIFPPLTKLLWCS